VRAAAESQISLLTSAWSAITPVSSKTTASAPARVALDAPHALDATALTPPFGLFDRYLKPHPHSPFPERGNPWADRIAARADFPIYFIDDETAIRVSGDQTDIVSEGQWRATSACQAHGMYRALRFRVGWSGQQDRTSSAIWRLSGCGATTIRSRARTKRLCGFG
jgi:hypothetical protein